jgi:hypothetical protein
MSGAQVSGALALREAITAAVRPASVKETKARVAGLPTCGFRPLLRIGLRLRAEVVAREHATGMEQG